MRFFKTIFGNKFFTASFWMFIGTGFLNFGNYLYHLVTARLLGNAGYGELESLISLLYILSIPLLTLTIVIVKFVSKYKGKNDYVSISQLYFYFREKVILFGLIFSLLLLLLSPILQSFLHLSSFWFIVILTANFFFSLLSMLGRSILQGLSNFLGMSITNFIETFSKVITALVLVLVGYKVLGAFAGTAIGAMLGGIAALYIISRYHFKERGFKDASHIVKFSLPAFLTTLGLTSLFTTDVVLARHFFPGVDSGNYAALSVMGKIIYFGVSPIMMVMFPFVSEHHAKGERYSHFLFMSIGLTLLGALFVVALYFLIPGLMIELLPGKAYLSVAPLLGLFGVFITIYSLCYLLSNFYLSLHKSVISYVIMVIAGLQVFMIYMFHTSLLAIIQVNIAVVSVLLVLLLLYYPYGTSAKK